MKAAFKSDKFHEEYKIYTSLRESFQEKNLALWWKRGDQDNYGGKAYLYSFQAAITGRFKKRGIFYRIVLDQILWKFCCVFQL
ncbi:hypothetical protein [Bartonella vinsonii]|uniref:hypothetical protein n=1 Tax=Bartonella vinsonii TaxID=33047 RepID=UPI0003A30008|nr:hypothetical protein [Bartonella vinsonii]